MLKILVVDDDSGLRMVVRNLLQSASDKYQVEESFDGLNALDKIKMIILM